MEACEVESYIYNEILIFIGRPLHSLTFHIGLCRPPFIRYDQIAWIIKIVLCRLLNSLTEKKTT